MDGALFLLGLQPVYYTAWPGGQERHIIEAQHGLIFAGYLKILTPLIVVIPGIVAFVLNPHLPKPDEAYPWLLNSFVPAGLKGLAFAALIAAIVSSLSSMANSTATIFSMDIYKQLFKKDASESNLVFTGRIVSTVALIIAVLIAPKLSSLQQAFQFIQEFTGFISSGIFAIFIFALFWKKSHCQFCTLGCCTDYSTFPGH